MPQNQPFRLTFITPTTQFVGVDISENLYDNIGVKKGNIIRQVKVNPLGTAFDGDEVGNTHFSKFCGQTDRQRIMKGCPTHYKNLREIQKEKNKGTKRIILPKK